MLCEEGGTILAFRCKSGSKVTDFRWVTALAVVPSFQIANMSAGKVAATLGLF